jgi:predicted transposase/invertase (TIGR01784 family)
MEPKYHEHDIGYKHFFKYKKNVIELLSSFVKKDWTKNIKEENLILVDKSYIVGEFDEEEADIVYRLKLDDQEVIIYILLEFQSTVDYSMPIRLLFYMVEIWRDIFKNILRGKRKTKDFKLPVIVPIVLYNGTKPWTANRTFKESINGYELFGSNIIDFEYILLSVNDYSEKELTNISNLISAVFLMDQDIDTKELKSRLRKIIKILKHTTPEQFEGFKKWLLYIIKSRMPKEDQEEVDKVIKKASMKEVENMVYNLEKTLDNLKKEGIEEGIKEGKYIVAKRLLMKGQDIDTIVDVTELTREEIEKIINEMK